MKNKKSTEDHIKEVEQDDRIIQFDNGEEIRESARAEGIDIPNEEDWKKLEDWKEFAKNNPIDPAVVQYLEDNEIPYVYHPDKPRTGFVKPRPREEVLTMFDNEVASADVLRAIEKLDEENKRSDRFFGMRLNKSTDDIENTFLVMFAEFVSLMALLIGMLGFGVLLWAIYG